ncbi:MAG: amino acid permease [bacterium]
MSNASDQSTSDQSLERSLGLPEALTIGIGTMIGAGIFVFPGIASGRAGLAATVSYAIGACIALLVALPASELATAMPESGGGYYFVSGELGVGLEYRYRYRTVARINVCNHVLLDGV